MEFHQIWKQILKHQSEVFSTVTDKDFTYQVIDDVIVTNRTSRRLTKQNFENAFSMFPLTGPGEISNIIQGSSYVYAILTDKRISG